MKEAGGMKLDELHVGDRRARAVGHGHAVAGGDVRVGGVKINFAAAAGGEQDGAGGEGFDLVAFLSRT